MEVGEEPDHLTGDLAGEGPGSWEVGVKEDLGGGSLSLVRLRNIRVNTCNTHITEILRIIMILPRSRAGSSVERLSLTLAKSFSSFKN